MAILKVKTDCGWVEGLPAGNQMISIFKGIPYAAPPVGELRWKNPQPAAPWEGVRQCFKFPNISWQERRSSEGGGIVGNEFYCLDWPRSEDCLYLNVWTPALKGDEKLPVAVYMHGGGFSSGYGFLNCYDGESFAKRGVVFVTINHRLNGFGFMSHPWLTAEDEEHHSSGNYGAFDLIAALQWVKRNIAAFGGDPEQVTIFGQSGGGGKVQTMTASPLTRGLFQRAIMQSGGGLSDQMGAHGLEEGEAFGVKFFDFMGYKTLAEARAADAETLLEGLNKFLKEGGRGMSAMCPKVDGWLLEELPRDVFVGGKHPALDYMVGCTSQEFYRPDAPLPAAESVRAAGAKLFGDRAEGYVAASHIEDDEAKAKAVFCNQMGENMLASALAFAENEAAIGRKPVHAYYLTIVPPGADCAHHSAEHHYVFQTLGRSTRPYGGRDWDLSNQLCDYWTNFVKTGDPNGAGLPAWDGFTAESGKVMEITYDLKMIDPPVDDYVRFVRDYALGKI